MSKYLLGFPSIQVSSLFDKQRTLRLEMYLESFLFWFQHAHYWFNFCSVLRLLSMRANPHQPSVNAVTLGLFICYSAKMSGWAAGFSAPQSSQAARLQLPTSIMPCGQQGVCVGSGTTFLRAPWKIPIGMAFMNLLQKAHLSEEHFIS